MNKKLVGAVTAIFILLMSFSVFSLVDTSSLLANETTKLDDPKNTLRNSAVSHLFDGMLTEYIWTYMGTDPGPSHFSYSHISGSMFQGDWWFNYVGYDYHTFYDVDATTRIMTNIGGDAFYNPGQHDPGWIFTDINLGDIIPIAIWFGEEHMFLVSGELVYDLPGYGLVDVWELTDLDYPGGWAWYEKSTGILLMGMFSTSYGEYFTLDFVDTNAFSPPSGQVAIFRNVLPWDFDVTAPILNMYGISYTVYSSADMGVVDLSSYEKVIIESDQNQLFYDTLGMNIAWFESYASSGGILEIHACDMGWNLGTWDGLYLMPGGVDQVHILTDNILINLPTHPIVNDPHTITDAELDSWSASAHGSFVTYPAGSKEILLDGDSLNPVFIEFDFGAGTILLSMQTLELGYGYGYSLFLENVILYTPSPPDSITVTSPDGSSSWATGTTHSITWTSTGSISDVKIELFKDGAFDSEIIASTANDGEYPWTIPSGLVDSTQYQIKISDVSNPTTHDFSDYFEIFTSVIDGQLFDGMYTNYSFMFTNTIGTEYMGYSHFSYSYISGSIFEGNWWIYLVDEGYDYYTYYNVDSTTRIMTDVSGDALLGSGTHDPGWIFNVTDLGDNIPIGLLWGYEHIFNVSDELIYDLPGYGAVEVWVLEDLTIPGETVWYEKSTGILLNGTFINDRGAICSFNFNYTNVEFSYYIPDSLTITIPNSTSSWETGTTQSITWTSEGSISDVKIELFKDGAFDSVINASTPNDGEYSWTIPTTLLNSTQYQIKISDISNPTTEDFSDNFEIFTPAPPEEDSLTITNPDSLTAWEMGTSQEITWASTGSITDVKIEIFKDGVFILDIVVSTENDGSYTWDIPTDLEDGIDYQIKISDVSNSATYDESPNFAITSVDIPGDGAIPSYNLYIIIGIISVVSVILLKNRKKITTK